MSLQENIKLFLHSLAYRINNYVNPKQIFFNIIFFYKTQCLLGNKKLKLNSKHNRKRAAVFCYGNMNSILMQSFHIKSLNELGYKIIGILDNYNLSIQKLYKKFGVNEFVYLDPYVFVSKKPKNISVDISNIKNVKKFNYRNIPVGKLALSTTMRLLKKSRFNNLEMKILSEKILNSVKVVDIYYLLINKIKPEICIFLDRGYTPEAELFEVAIQNKIECVEIHLSHRSEYLTFKRYNKKNRFMHFNSLSKKTWKNIETKKISKVQENEFLKELNFCYNSGRWYEEVGTQYDKVFVSKEQFYNSLQLDKNLKTAVLFSHIFWDGTFFYGKDLFTDYEDWFKETIKIMIKNKNMNWLIKVHPANKVKDARDNMSNYSEFNAIKDIINKLPKNIKLIDFDHKVSTLSYFNIIDYCLTVRGTVGIEAACFGIPVITAGSGRYDNLGFTKDHKNKKDYLNTILNLHKVKVNKEKTKQLALKFAYYLYIIRTFSTDHLHFYFDKNDKNDNNSMFCNIKNSNHNELFDVDGINKLKDWILSKEEDYLEIKKYNYD